MSELYDKADGRVVIRIILSRDFLNELMKGAPLARVTRVACPQKLKSPVALDAP